jgi:hypothetical protein
VTWLYQTYVEINKTIRNVSVKWYKRIFLWGSRYKIMSQLEIEQKVRQEQILDEFIEVSDYYIIHIDVGTDAGKF